MIECAVISISLGYIGWAAGYFFEAYRASLTFVCLAVAILFVPTVYDVNSHGTIEVGKENCHEANTATTEVPQDGE